MKKKIKIGEIVRELMDDESLFFFKQKTAYEIGTGDWSSDVCSSDLGPAATRNGQYKKRGCCRSENW